MIRIRYMKVCVFISWISLFFLSVHFFQTINVGNTVHPITRRGNRKYYIEKKSSPRVTASRERLDSALTSFLDISHTIDIILGLVKKQDAYPNLNTLKKMQNLFANQNSTEFSSSFCPERITPSSKFTPKVSVVISLYKTNMVESLFYLSRTLKQIPDSLTDDVIIISEASIPDLHKSSIEGAMDVCSKCRLFWHNESVNLARDTFIRFARTDFVIFIDSRVTILPETLSHLSKILDSHPEAIVSPNMQICSHKYLQCTTGNYKLGLSWDLSVVRIPYAEQKVEVNLNYGYAKKQSNKELKEMGLFRQSAINQDIFAVRKSFYERIKGLDRFNEGEGAEMAGLSLKVYSCGGEILVSMCSDAVFNVFDMKRSAFGLNPQRNPSFEILEKYKVKQYVKVLRDAWFDRKSLLTSLCTESLRLTAPAMESRRFKQRLEIGKCSLNTFKYFIKAFQKDLIRPAKNATNFGYVRTRNELLALGWEVTPTSNTSGATLHRVIVTRNSSLWAGHFSVSNGMVILGDGDICLTSQPSGNFSLSTCDKSNPSQKFSITKDDEIRLARFPQHCACFESTTDAISVPLTIQQCQNVKYSCHLRFDLRLRPNCIR